MSAAEVFPGQIVAVKGVNLYGKRLVVKELYLDASKPFRYAIVVTKKQWRGSLRYSIELIFRTPIQSIPSLKVVVACGPFHIENTGFQPFQDLLNKINETTPDVVILVSN